MDGLLLNRFRKVSLLYLILTFSVVLLVVVAALVNQKFSETAFNFKKVHEGNRLINDMHDIQSTLTIAGTSVRSYLIKRDQLTFTRLPEYHKIISTKIDNVRNILKTYPDQRPYVDSLQENVELKFKLWNQLIGVSRDSLAVIDEELMLVNTQIMRNILHETNEISTYTILAVENYISDTESDMRTTSILALAATLLCVSMIIFSLVKLNNEVKHGVLTQAVLKRKVDELDRSNADLERFAYVASHDLHAPLRKLYAFSEILLEREKNIGQEGIDIIKRMHLIVTRMQRLIDDMLEFSLHLHKADATIINLNYLAKNVKSNLAVSISESGATIDIGTLPDRISGHESQLDQLFQNIISNSIKYASQGLAPHIRIWSSIVTGADIEGVSSVDEKKKFHKIVFSDNGIGFDNKYKEKIFVIFQRLHGKSEYEGSGIGLATCKKVMENHGGYITACGKENSGAEFSVYFPVV